MITIVPRNFFGKLLILACQRKMQFTHRFIVSVDQMPICFSYSLLILLQHHIN